VVEAELVLEVAVLRLLGGQLHELLIALVLCEHLLGEREPALLARLLGLDVFLLHAADGVLEVQHARPQRRQPGIDLQGALVRGARLVEVPGGFEDTPDGQLRIHALRVQERALLGLGDRGVPVARVLREQHRAERRERLGVLLLRGRHLLRLRDRLRMLSRSRQRRGQPEPRAVQLRIQLERLAVRRDRLVLAAEREQRVALGLVRERAALRRPRSPCQPTPARHARRRRGPARGPAQPGRPGCLRSPLRARRSALPCRST
jgi:hypothetical protein